MRCCEVLWGSGNTTRAPLAVFLVLFGMRCCRCCDLLNRWPQMKNIQYTSVLGKYWSHLYILRFSSYVTKTTDLPCIFNYISCISSPSWWVHSSRTALGWFFFWMEVSVLLCNHSYAVKLYRWVSPSWRGTRHRASLQFCLYSLVVEVKIKSAFICVIVQGKNKVFKG